MWLICRHIFWIVVRAQVWAKWELLKRESHENIIIIYRNCPVLSVFSLEPLLGGTSTIERGLRCLQIWRPINAAVQRSTTISMWAHKHCTRFRGLAVLGWRPKYLAGGKTDVWGVVHYRVGKGCPQAAWRQRAQEEHIFQTNSSRRPQRRGRGARHLAVVRECLEYIVACVNC